MGTPPLSLAEVEDGERGGRLRTGKLYRDGAIDGRAVGGEKAVDKDRDGEQARLDERYYRHARASSAGLRLQLRDIQ